MAVEDPVAVAVPIVGAPGTVKGVALLLAALAAPVSRQAVAAGFRNRLLWHGGPEGWDL